MRYAFLHKNFRELNFEKRVIFVCHLLTLAFCWFPWFEARLGDYSEPFDYHAFQGPGFLIGVFIFLISLFMIVYFLDRLFESERVQLPISENALFFGSSLLQILLIVLAWSVLFAIGKDYAEGSIRFGIFLVFVSQIAALVATFLNFQLGRQQQVRSFFRHPDDNSPQE